MAGLLSPNVDAESLVLGLINRQDRHLARRTCQAWRRELGARTTTLVLSEDEAGEAVLASVDLVSSFPALRTLVLRRKKAAWEGWPERLAAFISRNAAALQQLQHLDLGYDDNSAALIASVALAALAQLPGLQSLHARVDEELSPPLLGGAGLPQAADRLARRRMGRAQDEHLQHIVDAAPQLRELWLSTKEISRPEQLACLTGLRSLSSLQLSVHDNAAPAVLSLTALQGPTHLALDAEQLDDLMPAVGQLTGLVSLEL
jgi:hypothetical protein